MDTPSEGMDMGRLSVISDMDGVIYRGKELIPGAQDFVAHMRANDIPFLFLTNNSEQTPLDLKRKLEGMGIHGLTEANFITAAIATAQFLHAQRPHSTAYVVGGSGLTAELYKVGYSITESHPEYVVVGKTANFTFATMRKAAQLIDGGARFIGTNPDLIDPVEGGTEPAAGAILAAIEAATGRKAYIVGKPNSLMMIYARQMLGAHAEDCVMIGDRMDTDIVGGLEAGMSTALVLSGVSDRETVEHFPYRPDHVFDSVASIDWDALTGGLEPELSGDPSHDSAHDSTSGSAVAAGPAPGATT